MKKINDLIKQNKRILSLEITPNQNLDLNQLIKLNPSFISITWIGNDENEPEEIASISFAKKLISSGLHALLHVPCRNLSKKRSLDILNYLKRSTKIVNILILTGESKYIKEKDDAKVDFPYASQFVKFIKENFGNYFEIGVTGYPEKHPKSATFNEDFSFLKNKVSQGADFILTQGSFSFESLEIFQKNCVLTNINVPIIVGCPLVSSYKSLLLFKNLCKIPADDEIVNYAERNRDNENNLIKFGIEICKKIGQNVLDRKECFSGLHIFTMNNLEVTERLLENLK